MLAAREIRLDRGADEIGVRGFLRFLCGAGHDAILADRKKHYRNSPRTESAALPAPFVTLLMAAVAARVALAVSAPITCRTTSPAVAPLVRLPMSRRRTSGMDVVMAVPPVRPPATVALLERITRLSMIIFFSGPPAEA